jgi:hypothetical protein
MVRIIPAFVAVAFGVGSLAPAHAALDTSFALDSDSEFLSFVALSGFTKDFGGNVRWGNGGPSGDWELALVNGPETATFDQQQVDWNTGSAGNDHLVDFVYTPGGLDASLEIDFAGGVTSTHTGAPVPGPGSVNALLIRARADGSDVSTLSNIEVDWGAGSAGWSGALVGDGDAQYAVFVGDVLASGFTVSASAAFADGSGSLPMYGFKVGSVSDTQPPGSVVPLPAGAWLLGAGLAAYLGVGAQRRFQRPDGAIA